MTHVYTLFAIGNPIMNQLFSQGDDNLNKTENIVVLVKNDAKKRREKG